jgi:ClpP class serine protease
MPNHLTPGVWLIEPGRLRAYQAAYAERLRAGLPPVPPKAQHGPDGMADGPDDPPYCLADGIATIAVRGPLYYESSPLNDFMAWAFGGCCTQKVAAAVRCAAADTNARSILLDIDSPGGEAAGVGELAELVRDVASVKPTAAYTSMWAASGAYWIAAAAGELWAAPFAFLGSVGAYSEAYDDRGMLAQLGVERHVFRAKISPNKYPEPWEPDGAIQFQSLIDEVGRSFLDAVAAYRGKSASDAESDFGGGAMLPAADALKVGMVDRVGDLASLRRKLSGPNRARLARANPGPALRPAAASTTPAIVSSRPAGSGSPPSCPGSSGRPPARSRLIPPASSTTPARSSPTPTASPSR